MRYRTENAGGYISVRHVETDREVGVALEQLFFDLKGGVFDLCSSYNMAGVKLATVSSQTVRSPLRTPAIALAHHEEANGFPYLKDAAWNDHAGRVERRLGRLIADTALAFARGFCEAVGPGLAPTTRDQFAGSLAELAAMYRISCVGCFNAATNMEEPYFVNPTPSGPRLAFLDAASAYGIRELRARHPNLKDAELQKLLGWVLRWLQDALALANAKTNPSTKQ